MIEIVLLMAAGLVVVLAAGYSFVRPRDEDEPAVLESGVKRARSRSDD